MLFYFSGVGNSAWVAGALSRKLGDICLSIADEITKSAHYTLQEGEAVGFVFPVYSWAPPRIVLDFVRRISFSSKPSYVYMICTCGDDAGKTAKVFAGQIAAKGWPLQASYSIFMPNTYVCLPGFDVDTDAVAQKKLREAVLQIEQLAGSIQKREQGDYCYEGALPTLKTYVISPLFERFLCSSRWFSATDACISCRKCEKSCPVQNIIVENGKPKWGSRCTMCLACYHVCPVHAVRYGKFTQTKGQYRLPKK